MANERITTNADENADEKWEFYYKETRSWINREHELISNRIGWLLTSNAFLVTPLVLYYNTTSGLFQNFPYIITIFALALAIISFITIVSAVKTIKVLKERETILIVRNESLIRLNPDQDYEFSVEEKDKHMLNKIKYKSIRDNNFVHEKRNRCIHDLSITCTWLIPVLVLVFWIVILMKIP